MDELLSQLRAAAEPTRLRLLALCARHPLCVTDLCAVLGQSQPRLSRHLKLLTDAGLSELTLAQYREDIARLREAHADAPERLTLLDQLAAWGDLLAAGLDG